MALHWLNRYFLSYGTPLIHDDNDKPVEDGRQAIIARPPFLYAREQDEFQSLRQPPRTTSTTIVGCTDHQPGGTDCTDDKFPAHSQHAAISLAFESRMLSLPHDNRQWTFHCSFSIIAWLSCSTLASRSTYWYKVSTSSSLTSSSGDCRCRLGQTDWGPCGRFLL